MWFSFHISFIRSHVSRGNTIGSSKYFTPKLGFFRKWSSKDETHFRPGWFKYVWRDVSPHSLQDDFSQFYKRRLQQINSNNDAFNAVRQFSNFKRKSNSVDAIYLDEQKQLLVSSPEEIAEEFATKFLKNHQLTANVASPAEELVKNSIDHLNAIHCKIGLNDNIRADIENDESDKGILTSATEVTEIIMSRKNKISTGDDNMPCTVLKKLSFANVLRITIIFNQLLAVAYFPAVCKHAIGCPIPKPGEDSSYIGNWRPISLLNSLSKIFEVIMKRRLRRHFECNKFFSDDQFGFRPNRSTLHALAKLIVEVPAGHTNQFLLCILWQKRDKYRYSEHFWIGCPKIPLSLLPFTVFDVDVSLMIYCEATIEAKTVTKIPKVR